MSTDPRQRIVAAGIRIVETEGVGALSARRLAAETGTSTMAVYTHFRGMPDVVEAVAREAFARFTAALTDVAQTDDPVADFMVMGARYREFALADPRRYQMMFGTSTESLNRFHADITTSGSASSRSEFAMSFTALADAVARMIEAGRIRDDGVAVIAGRLWSISHGAVLLEMAGYFGDEGHGLAQILGPLTCDVLVGLGDTRENVDRSMRAAVAALGPSAAVGPQDRTRREAGRI